MGWPYDSYCDDAWLMALDEWKTRAPEMPSAPSREDEDARERRFDDLVMAMREFAAVEGWPAVCRCLGEAMDTQKGLIRG